MSLISRISLRNMKVRKGRTICVALSIFISMVFMTAAFLIYSSMSASYSNYLREGRSWKGDAGIYVYSEADAKAIKKSSMVRKSCEGCHLGEILTDGDYVQTEIAYYSDEMSDWMHCNPTEGRMPEKADEIVVSTDFLESRGIDPDKAINKTTEFEYNISDEKVNGSFIISGYYKSETSAKDMILVSGEYYAECVEKYKALGVKDTEFPILVEVIFSQNSDFEKLAKELISQTSIPVSEADYIVNSEVEGAFGTGMKAFVAVIFALIMVIGVFLILNTYSMSLNNDIILYRQLHALGVSKKELIKFVYIQIQLLTAIALLAGWICGILVTKTIVIPVLSHIISIEVRIDITPPLFIFTLLFAEIITFLCVFIVYRRIRKYTGINSCVKSVRYKKKNGIRIKNLCRRMAVRRIGANKGSFLFITFMLLLGVLICNGISSYISGFDAKKYISESLPVDYAVHSSTFKLDIKKRQGFEKEQLSGVNNLHGLIKSGGASITEVNAMLDSEAEKRFEQLGMQSEDERGTMHTYLYGLDRMFLEHMKVLKGTIDQEKLSSGNYCIIDSLGLEDTGRSCWNPGDKVQISGNSGAEKEYTVMAIVSFPYDLSYHSKWQSSSDIYIDEDEWQKFTGKNDYYLYVYDVEDKYQNTWDDTLKNITEKAGSLVYESAETKLEENQNYFNELRALSVLIIIITMIVILGGFLNIIINEMNSLKAESINLQRIGVARKELLSTFSVEVCSYMFFGVLLGTVFTPVVCRLFINELIAESYVTYKATWTIDILFLVFGAVISIVCCIIYWNNYLRKERYIHG